MSEIGDRLKLAISRRGLTLAEASERSGVPLRSIQNYTATSSEKAQKPGADVLIKFKESLGIDIAWLLTGEHSIANIFGRMLGGASSGITSADPDLAFELLCMAIDIVDIDHAAHVERTNTPLPFAYLARRVADQFRSLEEIYSEDFAGLSQRGVPASEVARLVALFWLRTGVGDDASAAKLEQVLRERSRERTETQDAPR